MQQEKNKQTVNPEILTTKLANIEVGNQVLAERGLGRVANAVRRMIEVVTAEAAQMLRQARAFKRAAEGDLLVPQYNAAAELKGWRLWPQATKANPKPMRLAAARESGWQTAGLVWADEAARDILRGYGHGVSVLMIAEGEPDALTLKLMTSQKIAVIGLCGAGAWTQAFGERITQWNKVNPQSCVIVLTDRDEAGERYAGQIRASIGPEVFVVRASGEAGRGDLNDLLRAGETSKIEKLMVTTREMPPTPTADAGRWRWSDDTHEWSERTEWVIKNPTLLVRDAISVEKEREEEIGSMVASAFKWWGAKLGALINAALIEGGTHGGGWASQALPLLRAADTLRDAAHLMDQTQRDHCAAAQADLAGAYESLRAAACAGARNAETKADRLRSLRGALTKAHNQPMTLERALQPLQRKAFKPKGGKAETRKDKRALATAKQQAQTQIQTMVRQAAEERAQAQAQADGLGGHEGQNAAAKGNVSAKTANEGRSGACVALVAEPLCLAAPGISFVVEPGPENLERVNHGNFTLCSRYLPKNLLSERLGDNWRTMVLKSSQGTGKTQAMAALVLKAIAEGRRVLILTHRRSLARSLALLFRAQCYLDDKGRLIIREGQVLVLSIDSLPRLVMGDLSPDLVIMDESEQATRHLFGSTIGDKLSVIAGDLFSLLKRAKHVVCADADAGPMTQRLLVDCAGRSHKLIYVNNTWNEWGFNLNGSRRVLLLKDHAKAGRMMLWSAVVKATQQLSDGQTLAVACTSKAQVAEIAQILKKAGLGKGVLVVTSKTKDTPEALAFLSDPNAKLPRVLIYSPTIGTGVSIDREVERVFVCGAAVEGITGPDIVQLMTRARNQRIPPLVWLEDRSFSHLPCTFDDSRAQLSRLFEEVVGHTERALHISAQARKLWRQRIVESALNGSSDDSRTFDLLVECLAETGRTGAHVLDSTLAALAERGVEVIEVNGDGADPMYEAAKDAREAIKAASIQAVVDAHSLPSDADLNVLRQLGTPEAHAACVRHDIERRGIEVTLTSATAACDGALDKGRKLTDAAIQARGGEVAAYVAEGVRASLAACPARLPALAGHARANWIFEVLKTVGLEAILTEDGSGLADDWSFNIGDLTLMEPLRVYLDTHRAAIESLGFKVPPLGCEIHYVRDWLIRRLDALGFKADRLNPLSGGKRVRKGQRPYYLTRASVIEAWKWARKPFADLVEAAELDVAMWQAAGCKLPLAA